MTTRHATLRDVAAAAGGSRATAAFALSDSSRVAVAQATRERVRQAARDLGYVPHGIARALREGSSRYIVLGLDWSLDGDQPLRPVRLRFAAEAGEMLGIPAPVPHAVPAGVLLQCCG